MLADPIAECKIRQGAKNQRNNSSVKRSSARLCRVGSDPAILQYPPAVIRLFRIKFRKLNPPSDFCPHPPTGSASYDSSSVRLPRNCWLYIQISGYVDSQEKMLRCLDLGWARTLQNLWGMSTNVGIDKALPSLTSLQP